jgi:hypothetical protein
MHPPPPGNDSRAALLWEVLKLTAKDAKNAKKRMERKSFISSFIKKHDFIPFRSSRSSCPSRLKSIFRNPLKLTVEDAFLFQPLKSRKDAKEAVFFGGFSRLFAVKTNF